MTEANLHDLIPFYLLGNLSPEEIIAVEEYLRLHPFVANEASQFVELFELWAYTVTPIEPQEKDFTLTRKTTKRNHITSTL